MWYKSFVETFSPNSVQIMCVSQIRNIGIAFNWHIDVPQDFIGLIFGKFVGLLLLIFALFAHQYLLELFRKDIDVSWEERKQVWIVKIDVEIQLLFFVRTR